MKASIQDLARRGVNDYFAEVRATLASIAETFPDVDLTAVLPKKASAPAPARVSSNGDRPAKRRRTMSPEARKRISEATRLRWAKAKQAGKTSLTKRGPGRPPKRKTAPKGSATA